MKFTLVSALAALSAVVVSAQETTSPISAAPESTSTSEIPGCSDQAGLIECLNQISSLTSTVSGCDLAQEYYNCYAIHCENSDLAVSGMNTFQHMQCSFYSEPVTTRSSSATSDVSATHTSNSSTESDNSEADTDGQSDDEDSGVSISAALSIGCIIPAVAAALYIA